MSNTYMYASSWTHGKGEGGIALFQMDENSGRLTFIEKVCAGNDFNVTVYDDKRGLLYALETGSKLPEFRAGGGGQVFVFRVDKDTGRLTLLGRAPLWSTNPAHMALDRSGKYIVVANHGTKSCITKVEQDAFGKYHPVVEFDDSTVELFALNDDGTVGELLDVVHHRGSGSEWRQLSAHPHSCEMSPDGRFFVVCDKGCDTVSVYSIDYERRKLRLVSKLQHEAETLPRYCKFSPDGRFLYQNNENAMELHVFRCRDEGSLELVEAVSSLPMDFDGVKKEGEVFEQQCLVLHPNGKYVYDVARGSNSVAVFERDEESGRLSHIQDVYTGGHWPRGFEVSPGGNFAVLSHVRDGEMKVYKIGEDGRLSPTEHSARLECAAYMTFYKA